MLRKGTELKQQEVETKLFHRWDLDLIANCQLLKGSSAQTLKTGAYAVDKEVARNKENSKL